MTPPREPARGRGTGSGLGSTGFGKVQGPAGPQKRKALCRGVGPFFGVLAGWSSARSGLALQTSIE